MNAKNLRFSSGTTSFYFGDKFSRLKQLADRRNSVIVTDEHVFDAHKEKFRSWNTIVLKPGESFKVQQTADAVIDQLIAFEADRNTTLIGVGGGVVTDITGYVASVYMRGIPFGFIPSTVLAMVDASIGGKNGVDVGVYKNMVGTIRQPGFILYDYSILSSLPQQEWRNGFAEIIKHAAIRDSRMFRELESNSIDEYQGNKRLLGALVQRNALLKAQIVKKDEFEKAERKLLNFGHTLGHALENIYELSHGEAISIGMTYAAQVSAQLNGFTGAARLVALLEQYGLPTFAAFNTKKVFSVMRMDKKKQQKDISFISLHRIGKGEVRVLKLRQLEQLISQLQ
ncbi:MAG TPA: 3-dehydroquinate synthase [Chitinophagaceae bacterium]